MISKRARAAEYMCPVLRGWLRTDSGQRTSRGRHKSSAAVCHSLAVSNIFSERQDGALRNSADQSRPRFASRTTMSTLAPVLRVNTERGAHAQYPPPNLNSGAGARNDLLKCCSLTWAQFSRACRTTAQTRGSGRLHLLVTFLNPK